MKRKIALLLAVLVVLAAMFAACGRTQPTAKRMRWENDVNSETYTFRVSLADFNTSENPETVFNVLQDTENYGDTQFARDLAINGEVFSSLDELRPLAVEGEYTLKIVKQDADNWAVETTQTLFAKYTNKVNDNLTLTEVEQPENKSLPFATASEVATLAPTLVGDEDTTVVLKSIISTRAVFEAETQLPISSVTESDGFYVGLQKQMASKYKVETSYDFSAKRPKVTVAMDGDTANAQTFRMPRNSTFIDANQLLVYLRSLEKTATSFQDSPAVRVFYPLTGELVTASFALQHDVPMVITDPARNPDFKFARLSVVTVSLNGMAYMVQENIPDDVKGSDDKVLDLMEGSEEHKYTTVGFRVGNLSYELNSYAESVWEALTYPKQASAE